MENISIQSVEVSKLSWFERRCRQLVFDQLSLLSGALLTIREGNDDHHFGDNKAELKAQLTVLSPQVYVKMVKGGSIGAAESFIEGEWSSNNLTQLIRVFARFQSVLDKLENSQSITAKLKNWLVHRNNRNSQIQAKKNIMAHYDLGNILYEQFLDKEMVYSSAIYADDQQTLEQAQIHKFDKICQRLELKPGETLVEIGTGWGGLAVHAAKHYGVHVTTTTISEEQYQFAKNKIEQLGLTNQITLLKDDYRDLTGQYDKLVSIEMIEAVGKEYFSTFFSQLNRLLKPQGKMLIQAITIADQRFEHYTKNVDFIQKYIFPGGCLPSVTVMSQHLTKYTDMVPEALYDIGLHYAKTLEEWRQRFNANWDKISQHGYDETFKRLWLYYLCYCEGAFLEQRVSTVHFVARKSV